MSDVCATMFARNTKSNDLRIDSNARGVRSHEEYTNFRAISSTETRKRAILRFHGVFGVVMLQMITCNFLLYEFSSRLTMVDG